MPILENIPATEAADIVNIAELTVKQLEQRYADKPPVLRGVHAKDHGCVTAKFKVEENLRADLRVGVFATPGHEYEALIRFSNASVAEDPDSTLDQKSGIPMHGSRGMAIKLLGVVGTPLLPTDERLTQDFLLINQPVFAFANVEDYLALSKVLFRDRDKPEGFFQRMGPTDEDGKPTTEVQRQRAARTLEIVGRIRGGKLEPFQKPPASPLDNRYFSAAPFLFGEDHAVKFSAQPVDPLVVDSLDVTDPRYLRTGLRKRLTAPGAGDVVFKFQVQIRTANNLADKIDTDIEDATVEWLEKEYPFTDVATITIPPQDFETAARRALCEILTFSPWHSLVEHRPLGGINRLRLPVYETSSHYRGAGGCPMSGIS